MTIMLIDNPVDTATVAASSAAALMPVDNLKEPERSKKWRSGSGTKSWVDITFGAEEARTFAALLDLNLTSGGTIRLQSWGTGFDTHQVKSVQGTPFTFTRTGATATRVNKAGKVEGCIANAPRFDYNLTTLAMRGLLAEDARTNYCLRSSEFDHAAWVKPDGSANPVGVNAAIAPDGTLTADNLSTNGPSTSSFYQDVALTGAPLANRTITASVYLKNNGGAISNITLRLIGVGGVDTQTTANAVMVSGWTRFSVTKTFSAGETATQVRFTLTSSGGTWNAFAWGAQVEEALAASSVILTTSASVTRNAESCSVATSSIPGYSGTTFSMFVEWESNGASASNQSPFGVAEGTDNNNCALIRETPTAIILQGRDTPNSFDLVMQPTPAVAGVNRAAVAIQTGANGVVGSANGGALAYTTATTLPSFNTVHLGTMNFLNGRIRKAHLYNVRLADADVFTLSQGGSIATAPVMTLDFTAEPGADIIVNPTLYAAAVAQANYGGGGYGQGNYGSTVAESQLDARNLTMIDFGSSYSQKYWRVTLEDTNTSFQELARLYITTPVEFTYNVSWGWRLSRIENSAAKKAIGGQRYVQERDSQLRIDGDFDYLTDNERSDMAVRLFEIGERTPIIFSIYPEATRRGLTTTLYGHFEDASFAHASHDINRFPFSVIEDL